MMMSWASCMGLNGMAWVLGWGFALLEIQTQALFVLIWFYILAFFQQSVQSLAVLNAVLGQ